MSQETINLIIGALIGIIPTMLITWINQKNQDKKDKQARSWHMEDLFFNRKAANLERRLTQIEDFFSKAMVVITKLAKVALDTSADAYQNLPEGLESDINFLRDNSRHMIGVCNAIMDNEIKDLTQSLVIEIEHVIQVYEAVGNIQNERAGDRLDEVLELRKRVSKLRTQATNLYGDLLRSMDYWRTNLRPDREDFDYHNN